MLTKSSIAELMYRLNGENVNSASNVFMIMAGWCVDLKYTFLKFVRVCGIVASMVVQTFRFATFFARPIPATPLTRSVSRHLLSNEKFIHHIDFTFNGLLSWQGQKDKKKAKQMTVSEIKRSFPYNKTKTIKLVSFKMNFLLWRSRTRLSSNSCLWTWDT